MKALAWGIGGLGLLILAAGCQPELAGVKYGAEEQQWESYVDRNYSGFRPPRTAPPAIADKFSPKADEAAAPNGAMVPPADAEPPAPAADADAAEVIVTDTPPEAAPDATAAAPQEEQPAAELKLNEDGTYTVRPGDTLSYIAQKIYKDGRKYELIIKANPAIQQNPNYLKPGTRLAIPQP